MANQLQTGLVLSVHDIVCPGGTTPVNLAVRLLKRCVRQKFTYLNGQDRVPVSHPISKDDIKEEELYGPPSSFAARLDPSLSNLNEPFLEDREAIRVIQSGMTEVSAKMVEAARQISIVNAQQAPATTKMPAPGKDSVSALLARFFNARGLLHQVHTDRGADIGERFSGSLADAASKYMHTDEDNKGLLSSSEFD